MTLDEARTAVLDRLHRRGVGGADGVAIFDAATTTTSYGWIFYYDSRRYLESGDLIYSLAGHGPVVVIAEPFEIIELGSRHAPETAITMLEKERNLTHS